jgi:hypothetical protein
MLGSCSGAFSLTPTSQVRTAAALQLVMVKRRTMYREVVPSSMMFTPCYTKIHLLVQMLLESIHTNLIPLAHLLLSNNEKKEIAKSKRNCNLICKHPVCYMCMYLLRFSFNTLILGYKVIKLDNFIKYKIIML